MKIAFIGDKKGKVHSNRYEIFCRYLPFDFRFFTVKERINVARFDRIYYASFPLYRRSPIEHHSIFGSATSWKCTLSNDDLELMSKFRRLSANNFALYQVLKKQYKSIQYIPNGVDADFYSPVPHDKNDRLRIGWVGNKDRQEKNYKTLLKPIIKKLKNSVDFDIIATSKSMDTKGLRSSKEMRRFYRCLDFFLVVSSTEGTPNPALEAAACGIPIVSTPVGNMPELIRDGINGFVVSCKEKAIVSRLSALSSISNNEYQLLSTNIRNDIIEDWDWKKSCFRFKEFFES